MQLLLYMKNFFTGNFGISYHYGEPVIRIIMDRLPNTIMLFTTASILYALAGIAWGKIIAWKKGSFTDVSVTFVGLSHLHAVPPLVRAAHDLAVRLQAGAGFRSTA